MPDTVPPWIQLLIIYLTIAVTLGYIFMGIIIWAIIDVQKERIGLCTKSSV